MFEELKSPSETASIPAATKIASVPAASAGAWKLTAPMTSFTAISVSPVCSVNLTVELSAVAVCFKIIPSLCTCWTRTSLLLPKYILLPSNIPISPEG